MRPIPAWLPSSTCAAALWALACLPAAPQAQAQAQPEETGVGVELVLAIDVSRSMDDTEEAIQREGYARAFRDPGVQTAIFNGGWGRVAVTYVEWAGAETQAVMIPWTLIDTPEAAERFAARIETAPVIGRSRTSISGAIGFSAGLFDKNGFRGLRRVIDISGDGPNNSGGPVAQARDAAVARGITINGLPLMIETADGGETFMHWGYIPNLDAYYADCVIGGPSAFSLPVRGWDQFDMAVRRKLVLELAGGPPSAVVIPAQAEAPVDCMVGEKMWQQRWGGN